LVPKSKRERENLITFPCVGGGKGDDAALIKGGKRKKIP